MFEPLDVALIGLLAACLGAAAVLAMAEVSLIRVQRAAVLIEADGGSARARQLLHLLDDLPVVLNTVLLLVLFVQVGAATTAGFLAGRLFGGLGVSLASAGVTLVLFIYGEAIPKTAAVRDPQHHAMRATPLIRILVRAFGPVVAVVVKVADLQTRDASISLGVVTEDELRALARESAAVGEIADSDATLVERSFEFGDTTTADVMVPRDEIVALRGGQGVEEGINNAIRAGHRRMPVTAEDLDDIVGMVRLRDLAAAASSDADAKVQSAVGHVLRCPPDYPITSLLADMQSSSVWMAIVEEDGITLGLATIEDLVSELVGEIADQRRVWGD